MDWILEGGSAEEMLRKLPTMLFYFNKYLQISERAFAVAGLTRGSECTFFKRTLKDDDLKEFRAGAHP